MEMSALGDANGALLLTVSQILSGKLTFFEHLKLTSLDYIYLVIVKLLSKLIFCK